jgi:hypothetical protein
LYLLLFENLPFGGDEMNFEGIWGACSLSAIAFCVVFLVLSGLTGLIFAMRLFSGSRKNG